jgi:hypothetical protein
MHTNECDRRREIRSRLQAGMLEEIIVGRWTHDVQILASEALGLERPD